MMASTQTNIMFFSAMGADDGLIGINGCLLTYNPQIFRYTAEGQIVSSDFCFTIDKKKPGSIVSLDLSLFFDFKYSTATFFKVGYFLSLLYTIFLLCISIVFNLSF